MVGDKRAVIEWLANQQDEKQYKIDIYRPKRTLTANAFYWSALTMIAECLKVSTAYVHNKLLRECAPPMEVEGKLMYVFLPDTEDAENTALESMTYHLRPTSQVKPGKAGQPDYRAYILLKGSSDFNSKEMATLIDKAVEHCKELGLTPPPTAEIRAALDRMEKGEKKHEKQGS